MTIVLQSLIDKQDNFEIVRDQIALILVTEVANQKALAIADSKDPAEWDLRVYTERSNAWDNLGFVDGKTKVPIVNIWFETYTTIPGQSNTVARQKVDATYRIDCYGCGRSTETAEGHDPGDKEAAFEVQRALRLTRNILMADTNTYLQLRGLVWRRMPRSITSFQQELTDANARQVHGLAMDFVVGFSEFSPQYEAETLEKVVVSAKRAEDGEVLYETEQDY